MANKNYEQNPLIWDTDYFGINSARVNLNGIIDEQGQDKIIEFCKDYDFITISNINNVKENNYWIGNKTNAFLVDMNIQFIKLLEAKQIYQVDKTYVCNCYKRNEQVLDIAKKSFQHSRFFNDPNIPRSKAKNIYLHWTKCAFEQMDKYFVICEREGDVAGYILFSMNNDSSVIELIAVDEKYQGKRVGSSLIDTMELFVLEKGVKKVKVGTQVNNIHGFRFYIKKGFEFVSCRSVYHLWGR